MGGECDRCERSYMGGRTEGRSGGGTEGRKNAVYGVKRGITIKIRITIRKKIKSRSKSRSRRRGRGNVTHVTE